MDAPWFPHYEPSVPHSLRLPSITLPAMFEQTARRFPNNVATKFILKYLAGGAITIGGTQTYAQLRQHIAQFAAALVARGVQPGDRVAIMLPNSPQYVIAFYGALSAGAVVVNVNPTYTARELKHQLNDSGAEVVVLLNLFLPRLQEIKAETPVRHTVVSHIFDLLPFPARLLVERAQRKTPEWVDVVPTADTEMFEALLNHAAPPAPPLPADPDQVALFQYTGGTTGLPKAAMLTHRNLVANVIQVTAWMTSCEPGREQVMGAIPYFHVYGLTVGMNFTIYVGGTQILMPNPRPLENVMRIIHHERATIFPGVPAMYIGIVNHPQVAKYDLRSVKACICGSAALPIEIQDRFNALTGGRLVEGYGLTETSPTTHANPVYGERRSGSIGLPLPNVEAVIVDEQGLPLMPGDPASGELWVRGPMVMRGYWNHPDDDALDADGWLHTGDIARMDRDGYFYIVDRKKDMINASGYKVLPREVEEVLFRHPAVLEAAVAGVPDPKRGENVKAFIVLRPGASATVAELEAFCRADLAPYKVPHAWEFRTELPKTTVGKVLRRVLVAETVAQATPLPS